MVKKLLIFLLCVGVAACQRVGDDSQNEASVRIALNTDSMSVVISRAAPTTSELGARLENTKGEALKVWASVDDIAGSSIKMVPGSYRFVAFNGTSVDFPSWTKEYWQGENKFKVAANETKTIDVVVKSGVVKAKVAFDAAFDKYYTNYSVDIRTTTPATPGTNFLNFVKGETRTGSFLPGTLRIRFHMTSKSDNQVYTFSPPQPIAQTAVGAELYNISLKVNENTGTPTISVVLDNNVTVMEVNPMLPNGSLPKAAPVLSAVNFSLATPVSHLEGEGSSVRLCAAIKAPAGVKSLTITPKGAALVEKLGSLPYEIVGISAADKKKLNDVGMEWTAALEVAATANVTYANADVNFTKIFEKGVYRANDPANTGSDYSFLVEIKDMFDQKPLAINPPFNATLLIKKLGFALETPTLGNIWAKRAILYTTCNVGTVVPKIEIKKATDLTWTTAAQESKSVTGTDNRREVIVTGLEANTEYHFRAVVGTHTSSESGFVFKTEEAKVLENGEMENWQSSQLSTGPHKVPYFSPWANGKDPFWTTNNDRTTSYRTGGFTYGYNCFPAVSSTLSKHTGSRAAEIRTTSASNISALNTTSITQKHSQVAGLLYIGDFSYVKPNDTKTEGKSFDCRPESFSFWYTYDSYNTDKFDARITLWSGNTKIGEGVYTSPAASVATYTQCTVKVFYTNELLRADKMTIVFRSTNKAIPEVEKKTLAIDYEPDMDYNKNWSAWVGSKLRVDDITLNY
ncbi:MAG: DUF4493 domain-containing protein [Mucinivorans sp.]